MDKVPEKAKVIAELDGKKIPFYPLSPGTQRALVGIGPNRAPQPTPLTIRWKRPFRPDRKKTLPLQVLAVSWPQSSIFMPPRKMGLLDDARRKQGRQRLAEVLKTETPQQNWTGKFLRPARGKIRSSFGKQRTLQTTGQERDWGQHRGVDIAAPKNTLVRASNRGQVIAAEPFVLEGRLIALNHGQGILSLYMHLAEFLVKPGEVVEKGAPIGRIGSEGFSTGSHLHWAIYVHGVPVNPLSWEKSEF
ncbi:MAG: M23 family metallopeptidase [Elusimicrobia bacterium]|nr:M23 family metallopeptidase [Elusimicrobiota bacterium]